MASSWVDAMVEIAKLDQRQLAALEESAMRRVNELFDYLEESAEQKLSLVEMCNACASLNRYIRDQDDAKKSGDMQHIFDASFIQAGVGALVMLAVAREGKTS